MRVLDRYIVLVLGRYIALSMAVLLVLAAVFLFVNEQGWTGAGRYGQPQALRYVLMQLPATGLTFLPIAVLLGALLGLGQLARGSELTVLRAAGVSVARIAGSIALTGVLLLPFALMAGEWLAPPLAQSSRITKALERNGGLGAAQGSAWLRDGERVLRVDAKGGVAIFDLASPVQLSAITRARATQPLPDGGWQLGDAAQTRFDGRQLSVHEAPAVLQTTAGGDLLRAASHDPRQQSLRELAADIRAIEARQQDARRQRFAFWSGVARLLAIPLAMLLALPMLLGFLRSSEAGARATVGLVLGLGYFIAQRMVESGALVFDVAPALLAWLPTLLLAAAVGVLLWRARGLGTRA